MPNSGDHQAGHRPPVKFSLGLDQVTRGICGLLPVSGRLGTGLVCAGIVQPKAGGITAGA